MTPRDVAAETVVLTARGAIRAADVVRGDTVLLLDGNGHMQNITVREVSDPRPETCSMVLSEAGDIAVPPGEPILSTAGPVAPSELGPVGARAAKLEVLQPRDVLDALPASAVKRAAAKDRAAAALAALTRPFAMLPAVVARETVAAVDEVIAAAKVRATFRATNRWHAWTWDAVPETPAAVLPDASALRALTAWADGESRTMLEQYVTRATLVAAMVMAKTPVSLSWTPGYRPVECRITTARDQRTTAKVAWVQPRTSAVVTLRLAHPGALVCSQLAVGRLV